MCTFTTVSIDMVNFVVNGEKLMSPTGNLENLTHQKLGAPDTTIRSLKIDNPMCLLHCPPLTPVDTLKFKNAPGVDLELYKKLQWTGKPLKEVTIEEYRGDEEVYKIPCIATAKKWIISGTVPLGAICASKVPLIELTAHGLSIDDLIDHYQRWRQEDHQPPTHFEFTANNGHDTQWKMTAEWGSAKRIIMKN